MLVLASGSPYRAQLLERLEVPFTTQEPGYDERQDDHLFHKLAPHDFALHLARQKAKCVHEKLDSDQTDTWVLAADQIGVLQENGRAVLLGKPGSHERAVEQLMRLAGRTHELITGVLLLGPDGEHTCIDRQALTMRAYDRDEANAYVTKYKPTDCAGSYRIEDAGIKLIAKVEGQDYTGIIGLPLIAVASMLRQARLL